MMRRANPDVVYLRTVSKILSMILLLAGCAYASTSEKDPGLQEEVGELSSDGVLEHLTEPLGQNPLEEENKFDDPLTRSRRLENVEVRDLDISQAGHEVREFENDNLEKFSAPSSSTIDLTDVSDSCTYTASRNVNCRASDYPESSLIAILMQNSEAQLLYLNPNFTHGMFELPNDSQCWVPFVFMEGPSDPLDSCKVYVVEPPSIPDLSAPGGAKPPACSSGLDEPTCAAAGGTWKSGGAAPPYCDCN